MRKVLFLALLALTPSLFSLEAVIVEITGRVKIRMSADGRWQKAETGQVLPADGMISTGLKSTAKLDLGNAELEVLPLTRMSVDALVDSEESVSTSLFLKGGKIKANVKAIEGKENDFKIKSPVATASVRGTSFEFSGNELKVTQGKVAFYRTPEKMKDKPVPPAEEKAMEKEVPPEQMISVKAGAGTEMAGPKKRPVPPAQAAAQKISVPPSTKPPVVIEGRPPKKQGLPEQRDEQRPPGEGPAIVTVTIIIE